MLSLLLEEENELWDYEFFTSVLHFLQVKINQYGEILNFSFFCYDLLLVGNSFAGEEK